MRQSISSYAPTADRHGSVATLTQDNYAMPTTGNHTDEDDGITHSVLPRAAVAMLPPVLVRCPACFPEIQADVVIV